MLLVQRVEDVGLEEVHVLLGQRAGLVLRRSIVANAEHVSIGALDSAKHA